MCDIATCIAFINHACTLTDSDNPLYEDPSPNVKEPPIYELVGPDSKDITIETNEAYTDHMMMNLNTAYEISWANHHQQCDM